MELTRDQRWKKFVNLHPKKLSHDELISRLEDRLIFHPNKYTDEFIIEQAVDFARWLKGLGSVGENEVKKEVKKDAEKEQKKEIEKKVKQGLSMAPKI